MEFLPEITVHLENKPGRLAKICSALAKEKVNIRALSVMDGAGPSRLRMIVDDVDTTRRVLTELGSEYQTTEVLAVDIDHRPGTLARILERLAGEHINIEYAYVSQTDPAGRVLGIFHTSNSKRARQLLIDSASSNGDGRGGRRPLFVR